MYICMCLCMCTWGERASGGAGCVRVISDNSQMYSVQSLSLYSVVCSSVVKLVG